MSVTRLPRLVIHALNHPEGWRVSVGQSWAIGPHAQESSTDFVSLRENPFRA
jgi:hypothetical protein